MATATHTQFGSRTQLTVTGTLTSYGAGTRLPIETTGESSLVQLLRVKLHSGLPPKWVVLSEAQGWTLPCLVVTDEFDAALSWSPVA